VPAFDWARETARHVGTVAHRFLGRIAHEGLDAWPAARVPSLARRVRAELEASGVDAPELDRAVGNVLDVLQRTLADERGRWLFDPTHQQPASEWALAGVDGDAVVHVVLDRTFVCGGERWIVDFKTGTHEGGDVRAFLDSEVERYRDTMQRYGRMLAALEKRKVRLALYYPLVEGGFREVGTAPPVSVPTPAAGTQLGLF